jgi:hypothetical protein
MILVISVVAVVVASSTSHAQMQVVRMNSSPLLGGQFVNIHVGLEGSMYRVFELDDHGRPIEILDNSLTMATEHYHDFSS